MTLTYGLRLFCLLLVVAGLVDAALQLALSTSARFFLRQLDAAGSRRRERILYLVQVAPALLAIFLAGALCLPEYLRYEPTHEIEPVGWITLLLVAAVVIWFGTALFRGLRMTLRTLCFARLCRQSGRVVRRSGSIPVLVLAEPAPPLGVLGFFRPFIVISADLLGAGGLHSRALQVALDHERSHALHFDNWKLLFLCFLPRLHRDAWLWHWQHAADCAADDDAACGDGARSLSLAEALVRTARLVKPSRPLVISTALTSAETRLAVRVDRLLRPRRVHRSAGNALLLGLALLAALAVGAATVATPWVYTVSERILHLGGF
jgi:beta-lactamase regulating signal transducer with metallopeptidase domain